MIERSNNEHAVVLALRHGKANALDIELLSALEESLVELTDSKRGVVLTGFDSMFCAGVDLPRLLAGDISYAERLISALNSCFQAMIEFPRPLVAAINGHAIAGGLVLACACDYRLLSDTNAKLGLTELSVGVPFPPLALEVVREALGTPLTRKLALGARLYGPKDAKRMGLVDQLAAPEALVQAASTIVRRWSAIPAASFRITKSHLKSELVERWARSSKKFEAKVIASWQSEETLGAIESFVARRIGSRD